ncbi:MAG: pre-peptidase C-terminal domain-containing protein, partial [Gemmataceae bacterium]|nr:pre-peptidase C-terminal domain-containing protein [Gemmataceae bacterium]
MHTAGWKRWSARGPVLAALAMAWLASPLAAQRAAAQNVEQGKYLTEASAALIKLVNASNKQGFKLPDNTFSVGGGWINQSQTNWVALFTVELQAGKTYRFLAAGDADAKDVDLQVLDAAGKTVANDSGTEADAIVDYRPTATGRYTVRIRL